MVQVKLFLGLAAIASNVVAHPGHDPRVEAMERRAYYDSIPESKRSLSHCAAKLKARGIEQKSKARREALASVMKQKRGLEDFVKRSTDSVLNTTHASNDSSINLDVAQDYLFKDSTSCILAPEGEQGPYYVEGEYIRSNITETQNGVPLTLDIQIIDTNTCDPVPDVYIDLWSCNATGVYSGIVSSGNGNSAVASNINTTFLRGIVETDPEGVAAFDMIVPGHYSGRANHIHVVTHTNVTIYANHTMRGGSVQHVGQFFLDQDLLEKVEATYPYNTNDIDWTQNSEDRVFSTETATEGSDPVIQYIMLGDDVSDGLLGWISIGVDMSNNLTNTPDAEYYRTGGVMETSTDTTSTDGQGMSGNSTSNGTEGTPPSGSGSMPSGTASFA